VNKSGQFSVGAVGVINSFKKRLTYDLLLRLKEEQILSLGQN